MKFPSNINPIYHAQIKAKYEKAIRDRNSGATADKKRALRNKSVEEKKATRFDGQVNITVFTTRRRDTDHRAVEEKYVVDGLVSAGILQDDRKKYVAKLDVPEPEIGRDEKTIIVIEEI